MDSDGRRENYSERIQRHLERRRRIIVEIILEDFPVPWSAAVNASERDYARQTIAEESISARSPFIQAFNRLVAGWCPIMNAIRHHHKKTNLPLLLTSFLHRLRSDDLISDCEGDYEHMITRRCLHAINQNDTKRFLSIQRCHWSAKMLADQTSLRLIVVHLSLSHSFERIVARTINLSASVYVSRA